MQTLAWQTLGVLVATSAALASMALIHQLKPLLLRYAMARPNARSSHKTPTPQGGGIAVVAVTLTMALVLHLLGQLPGIASGQIALVSIAVLSLAVVGGVDDIRPLPVLPRLAVQFTAAGLFIWALPDGAAPLSALALPHIVERVLLTVGLVWFINLTNFMDGIDGITVAEIAPITLAIAVMAHLGALSPGMGIVALILFGALLGFAPYNRHVARLFLGDVGSLAIGGLVGWLLIVLAGAGHLAAAMILPLYYLADTGVTLYLRWRRGERLSQAHRTHFYQKAVQRGLSVPQVTRAILWLNALLAGLALVSVLAASAAVSLAMLVLAGGATAALLWRFERGGS